MSVKPTPVTRENIERWWSHVKGCGGFYQVASGGSFEAFAVAMARAELLYETLWGILWFNQDPALGWLLHPVLWGLSWWRHVGDLDEILEDMKRRTGTKVIYTNFPRDYRPLHRLAARFGFIDTGSSRRVEYRCVSALCAIYIREV
jgi:hypothetical protein